LGRRGSRPLVLWACPGNEVTKSGATWQIALVLGLSASLIVWLNWQTPRHETAELGSTQDHNKQRDAPSAHPRHYPQRMVTEPPQDAGARDCHPDERHGPALPAGRTPAITEGPRLEPHLAAEESLFLVVDLPILCLCSDL
jgi:hypothetical protein